MCSCHSSPECCVMFFGVKLSMGSSVLFLKIAHHRAKSIMWTDVINFFE